MSKANWCDTCLKPYEADSPDDPCPMCAAARAREGVTNTLSNEDVLSEGDVRELAERFAAEEHDCPRCAERIKVKAKVCRFCGFDLVSKTPDSPPKPSSRLKSRSSGSHVPAARNPDVAGEPLVKRKPRDAGARSRSGTLAILTVGACVVLGVAVVAAVNVKRPEPQSEADANAQVGFDDEAAARAQQATRERLDRQRAEANRDRARAAEGDRRGREEEQRKANVKSALDAASEAEKRGAARQALDALEVAEANGAAAADLSIQRGRLQARLEDERDLNGALARAEELNASEDFVGARSTALKVEATAGRLGRDAEVKDLLTRIDAGQKRKELLAQANAVLDKAERGLKNDELEYSQSLLDKARSMMADAPRLVPLERCLERCRHGEAYVEVDVESGRAIFAHRVPVSNAEYKAWLDSLPADKKRPSPWKRSPLADPATPPFPADQADAPVRGVALEDAKAFANARSERLPASDELDALRRVLKAEATEGEADGKGILGHAFRTVSDPSGSKASPENVAAAPTPGDPPNAAPRGGEKGAEAALLARARAWLMARRYLKCDSCKGTTKVTCGTCSGKGSITISRSDESGSRTNVCGDCNGGGLKSCPSSSCREGISTKKVEELAQRYGEYSPFCLPIADYAQRSLAVTFSDVDSRSARVSFDVQYVDGGATASEDSSWHLDRAGKWHLGVADATSEPGDKAKPRDAASGPADKGETRDWDETVEAYGRAIRESEKPNMTDLQLQKAHERVWKNFEGKPVRYTATLQNVTSTTWNGGPAVYVVLVTSKGTKLQITIIDKGDMSRFEKAEKGSVITAEGRVGAQSNQMSILGTKFVSVKKPSDAAQPPGGKPQPPKADDGVVDFVTFNKEYAAIGSSGDKTPDEISRAREDYIKSMLDKPTRYVVELVKAADETRAIDETREEKPVLRLDVKNDYFVRTGPFYAVIPSEMDRLRNAPKGSTIWIEGHITNKWTSDPHGMMTLEHYRVGSK